jgi:hypothetical protein
MTHTHTHTVGLLWTGDRPVAKTSDKTQHSQVTDIHVPGTIRTRNPNNQAPADPCIRPGSPDPSLFSFMWNLSRNISRLSHGFPLFALPMKMKLNTPWNIRINDSQHCKMPYRISLFVWREHPHTYSFVNWVIYIPSGLLVGFYPGLENS